MCRAICIALLVAVIASGQQRSFVTCPIVRDTKTVPCFLAEYDGETYFLGIQQDITSAFHPPQLKHEVLVEGTIMDGPRVCGGIPLEPVTISVIKEVNLNCNTLLPAEPEIEAPPAERGAGPSSRRPQPTSDASKSFNGAHEFTILYAFDDDFLDYTGNITVNEAAGYAKQVSATSVKILGYRATTILSNGNRMMEKAGLAEKRARNINALLEGLHVPNMSLEWQDEADSGDGRTDSSRRRVTILVTP